MARDKYNIYVEPKLLLVEGWYKNGLTIEQIAKNLGISKVTLYKYMDEHAELSERLKKSKEVADIEVENALFKSALGYEYEEVKQLIEEDKEGNKKKKIEKTKKFIPPNPTAIIFYLKNRKRKDWNDKQGETDEEKELRLKKLELENELLKVQINKLTGNNQEIEDTSDIDALLEGEVNASN